MPYSSLQGLSTSLPSQEEHRERSQTCFSAILSKMDFTAELQNPSVPPRGRARSRGHGWPRICHATRPATVPVHKATGGHVFATQPAREIRSEVDKPPASIASASDGVLCFDIYTFDILTSNIRTPPLTSIAGSNACQGFIAML